MTLETGLPVVIVQDLHHRLKVRLDFDFFTDPSFAPDGARLALTSYLNFGSDIVTYDLTSGHTKRLTASVAIAESPAWSPDGAFIAYASNREGDNNIYIIRPDGGDRRRVTTGQAGDRQPAWSPDGASIAFTSNRGGGWNLYSIDLASSELRQLTDHRAPDSSPDWSPDGKRIVFASGRDGASAIYLLDLETLEVSPLVVESRYDSLPKWRPDGGAVSFARSGRWRLAHHARRCGDRCIEPAGFARGQRRFAGLGAGLISFHHRGTESTEKLYEQGGRAPSIHAYRLQLTTCRGEPLGRLHAIPSVI